MLGKSAYGLGKVAELVAAGQLLDATASIQRMLGQLPAATPKSGTAASRKPPDIDGVAEHVANRENVAASQQTTMRSAFTGRGNLSDFAHAKQGVPPSSVSIPKAGQFLAGSFSNDAGSRPYKLYVPSRYSAGQALPLIVMLHGCTQSPDDFAAGTRMNDVAEEHNIFVLYPAQTSSANMQKCWNWFNEADQTRGAGEPSLIAGITRKIIDEYGVDAKRVFVAGLSAGGAAATIMANTYPDLYAAIGVHSGLACGAARDMPSAFNAMRQGAGGCAPQARGPHVPAIVFHGDKDTTVSARNADAVMTQMLGDRRFGAHVEQCRVPGGRSYTRTVHVDASGHRRQELWLIHGASHAWAGGSPSGSYTDPQGPDATREMVRFFLESTRQ